MLNIGILRRRRMGASLIAEYVAGGETPFFVADYEGDKYLGTISRFGDLSFSRASVGMSLDVDGDLQTATSGVERIDYDTGDRRLLLEPVAATNLNPYATDISSWSSATATIGTGETLLGIVSDRLTPSGTFHNARQDVTLSASTEHTIWHIVKTSSPYVRLRVYDNANATWVVNDEAFDLSGAGPTAGAGQHVYEIETGVWLIGHTFTTAAGSGVHWTLIYPDASAGSATVDVVFSQIEAGPTYTSPIPTSGTAVTRNAEVLALPAAKVSFNSSAFSFATTREVTYADEGASAQKTLFRWYADAGNYITVTLDTDGAKTGTVTLRVRKDSGTEATLSGSTELTPGRNVALVMAFTVTATELGLAINGTAETRVSSPGVPNLSSADMSFVYDDGAERHGNDIGWNLDIGDTGLEEASTPDFFT